MKWINIKEQLPEKGEYVLLETTYCKYPCIVGFHNGIEFKDADDKSKIINTDYWCKIVPRLKVGQKLKAITEEKMRHCGTNSLIIGKEYEILRIESDSMGEYVVIHSEISEDHCFYACSLTESFEIKTK